MRIVVAPDKFRGSLSAADAARFMAEGARRAAPLAEIIPIPMADGGEGTVEALVAATNGSIREARVRGPLGSPVIAQFGVVGDGKTAILEMASASGLTLIEPSHRDPASSSTYGTGELLRAALDAGVRRVILGIGGSATNDGGAGFAQALGYRLLDGEGNDIPPGGGSLNRLARIEAANADPRLTGIEISAACDVDNPLCGVRGASVIFGPQKGANPETISVLDRNLAHLAMIIERDLGKQVAELPGAGAAGGLGAGLVAFVGANLQPGVDLVAQAVGLEHAIRGADLVLTGEGAIDRSSAGGKTAMGVSRIARHLGVPAIGLAGTIGQGAEAALGGGMLAYFSICNRPMNLETAIKNAPELLASLAESVVRLFLAGRDSSR